ncbi:MAG: AAA family ATPase [Candidatus Eisenbacteria bacterium]|nr:AAA family ATPase [Candidatus Latescibacterota bacterium]MBD3301731.1 AAA family ATPase [Candidatus Eisenbacteria bacterium]
MTDAVQQEFPLEGLDPLRLFGQADHNLRALEQRLGITLVARNNVLTVRGEPEAVGKAMEVLRFLGERVRGGKVIDDGDLTYIFSVLEERANGIDNAPLPEAATVLFGDKRVIRVRTLGQAQYVEAMAKNDIVFGIGPAGTGKTYLAVAMAVRLLREKAVDRIVLARPAVEAGESLGFLPGDMQEKVDPYLRPLYDALHDMVSYERLQRLIQLGVVEIAPLAFMRGRTLSRSFVILDEAQNTSLGQMKMFLTRLGPNSKAAITGDITQIDLPKVEASGLILIRPILEGLEGVRFITFTERDVVRHQLVRDIIQAFDRHGTGPVLGRQS